MKKGFYYVNIGFMSVLILNFFTTAIPASAQKKIRPENKAVENPDSAFKRAYTRTLKDGESILAKTITFDLEMKKYPNLTPSELKEAEEMLHFVHNEAKAAHARMNTHIDSKMINGQKYIKMVAFKNEGFVQKFRDSFRSWKVFFGYPFFCTNPYLFYKYIDSLNGAIHEKDSSQKSALIQKYLLNELGLPPTASNNSFYNFWVKETDLFVPAIDSTFEQKLQLKDLDTTYLSAQLTYFKGSYAGANWDNKYPYSGCGATLCTNINAENDHPGLPEFVMKPNRTVVDIQIEKLSDYLREHHRKDVPGR